MAAEQGPREARTPSCEVRVAAVGTDGEADQDEDYATASGDDEPPTAPGGPREDTGAAAPGRANGPAQPSAEAPPPEAAAAVSSTAPPADAGMGGVRAPPRGPT